MAIDLTTGVARRVLAVGAAVARSGVGAVTASRTDNDTVGGGVLRDVPRLAQHFDAAVWRSDGFADEAESRTWSDRACGLACLRMLLGYHGLSVPDQRELLAGGLALGAYSRRGWIHAGLVDLAAGYELAGYAERDASLDRLVAAAAVDVPAIVSVARTFPPGRRGGHLIVFCGVARSGGRQSRIHFRDPSGWGAANREIAADRFLNAYARSAIFLWPQARDIPAFAQQLAAGG